MAPKFALFTKGSKLPLNKGLKNMFELLQCCAQPSNCSSQIGFLDTLIRLKDGRLGTDFYSKPTDKHLYLNTSLTTHLIYTTSTLYTLFSDRTIFQGTKTV